MVNLATPVTYVGRHVRDAMVYATDHMPQHWREHPMEPALDAAFAGCLILMAVGYATSTDVIFAGGTAGITAGGLMVLGKYLLG